MVQNLIDQVRPFLQVLQHKLLQELTQFDGKSFIRDGWQHASGGGGLTAVIENGHVFENGGCNFSHVYGNQLPPSATATRPQISGQAFQALGVSLVLHPRNPHVPTVHMNIRFFATEDQAGTPVWWFGGGMDLTPYFGVVKDCIHFHQICKNILDPFSLVLYPQMKQQCDTYFYLKHRREPRGIGGIFFDDFADLGFEQSFALLRSVGEGFLSAYLPIAKRQVDHPYTALETAFQHFRRGRYVEFNLVYDRGTLFGLQSGGRVESILMSLPTHVAWNYGVPAEFSAMQQTLLNEFLCAKNWLSTT